MKDSIGLFGGSFNPPHNGHINIVKTALEYFNFSRFILMPANASPIKEIKEGYSPEIRYFMTGMAFYTFFPEELEAFCPIDKNSRGWKDFKDFYIKSYATNHNSKIILSDFEVRKGGKSYTIDTVGYLKEIYHESEINIIVGMDEASILDQWKDHEKLFRIANFLVAERKGIDKEEVNKKFPFLKFFPSGIVDVSSTEVREKINSGEDFSHLVPEVIYRFIKSFQDKI